MSRLNVETREKIKCCEGCPFAGDEKEVDIINKCRKVSCYCAKLGERVVQIGFVPPECCPLPPFYGDSLEIEKDVRESYRAKVKNAGDGKITLDFYQETALSTAKPNIKGDIVYGALKMNGEAGEYAEKIGKVIRDKYGEFSDEDKRLLKLELGDVLWYIAHGADCLGVSLEEIAQMNMDKLSSRAERDKIGGSGDDR